MSDACPEDIDNPSIRASWHLLDARARAFFLQTSPARQIVPAQGSNNAPQPQRHAPVQGGMRPPQGPQYDGDEYLADREDNTSSRTMRIQGTRRSRPPSGSQSPSADPVDSARGPDGRRRRLSAGGRFAPTSDHPGANPVDPVLLRQDQETAIAYNRRLEERLAALEAQAATAPVVQGVASRGGSARGRGRGGRVRRQLRNAQAAVEAPPPGVEDDLDVVFCPDPDAEKDDSDPLIIANAKRNDELSPFQRKALKKCQAKVKVAFREVTGVLTTDDPWPKWTDGVAWTGPGLAINLDGTVTHPINRTLFRRVAEVAMQELKSDAATHASWMNAPDVKLTLGLLVEIAKGTFRGFKRPFKAQYDAEAKAHLEENESASRRMNRRRKTCGNLISVADIYMERHEGRDPRPFLIPDLMSDEASGPEDINVESQIAWKRRMAGIEGRVNVTDAELEKKSYLEKIDPNWRSEEMTRELRELYQIWWERLDARFANMMLTRITKSGRSTDTPPPYTPHNFGINQEWFEKNKGVPDFQILLRNWGKFEDPPGFGTNLDLEANLPPGTPSSLAEPSSSSGVSAAT